MTQPTVVSVKNDQLQQLPYDFIISTIFVSYMSMASKCVFTCNPLCRTIVQFKITTYLSAKIFDEYSQIPAFGFSPNLHRFCTFLIVLQVHVG